MIICTTDTVAGCTIVRTHGLVRGSSIRARHLGLDIMAKLRSLAGGEITEYSKMLGEVREQAIDRMVEEAQEMGANAVVTVRFQTAEAMSRAAELLCYGTAVTLEREP
jgi:uncharacterized protein YbjQ (UPF0145 family)